jgi:hypothetical protein
MLPEPGLRVLHFVGAANAVRGKPVDGAGVAFSVVRGGGLHPAWPIFGYRIRAGGVSLRWAMCQPIARYRGQKAAQLLRGESPDMEEIADASCPTEVIVGIEAVSFEVGQ